MAFGMRSPAHKWMIDHLHSVVLVIFHLEPIGRELAEQRDVRRVRTIAEPPRQPWQWTAGKQRARGPSVRSPQLHRLNNNIKAVHQ
jgi:hypothetical protein